MADINVYRPFSLFIPAKSHPEVIVQAISARDRSRAEAYAKSHGIPEVKDTYQGKAGYNCNERIYNILRCPKGMHN